MSKKDPTGAYAVECPKCKAQAGYSCFQVKRNGDFTAKELKEPHLSRKLAVHIEANKAQTPLVLPAAEILEQTLINLRSLRRRLCVYIAPASDKFCDCKLLRRNDTDLVQARSGEKSGCCEVRAAIAKLETIKEAMNGGDARICTHCGHGDSFHSTACIYAGCTCRRFRRKLNIV